jgi:hypothetical protein
MATSKQTIMAGQTNQYRVIKSKLLSAITPTITAMSVSDHFNSLLEIGACFTITPKKSKRAIILSGISQFLSITTVMHKMEIVVA